MFCTKCGARAPEGSRFCTGCGSSLEPAPKIPSAPKAPAAPASQGFARAGSLDMDLGDPAPVTPPKPAAPVAPPKPAAPVPMAPPAPTPMAPPTPTPMAPPAPTPMAPPAPAPMAPPAPAPKAPSGGDRRISAQRELKLLLRQGWLVMLGEKRNLIISLLFPVIAAVITVWIAGKDMFVNHESTKSACFILVCAGIWCGLFNSIATIVKERDNIKRDYVSGALRIECYTVSRAILQLVLCAVQSLVLTLSIPLVGLIYGNDVPGQGTLGLPSVVEYYLTILLIMYASDALGLMLSAFVKKEELASKLAPYILIAQLLFSGMLFEMKGAAQILSAVMVSRWGMEALGNISDINNIPSRSMIEFEEQPQLLPMIEESFKDSVNKALDQEVGTLLLVWFVLLAFVAVQLFACNAFLRKVKDDARS